MGARDDDDHDLESDGEGDGDGDGNGDGSLRGMRSVWLSMRDEEPSGRGMAELMAAARAQVEAKRPAPAWRRTLTALGELLRRPPVLALASIVVVAGVAVLVQSHGGAKIDEAPAAAQMPAAPEPAAAPMGAAAPAEGSAAAAVVTLAAAPVVRAKARPPAKVKPVPMSNTTDTTDTVDALDAEPSPPPDLAKSDRAPAPSNDQLLRECQAAAARGDCAAVRAAAGRIRAHDPAFYRSTVARDADVAKCLPPSPAN